MWRITRSQGGKEIAQKIKRRKVNWTGYIWQSASLRKQFIHNMLLKERQKGSEDEHIDVNSCGLTLRKLEDSTLWRIHFGSGRGPVVRQTDTVMIIITRTTYSHRALLHNKPACVVYNLHCCVYMLVYHKIHEHFGPRFVCLNKTLTEMTHEKAYCINALAEWRLKPTNVFDTGVQLWPRRSWQTRIAVKTTLS